MSRLSISAGLMLELAEEKYGLSAAVCMAGMLMDRSELLDPKREIAGTQELALLRNILRALDPDIPFGLMAGLRYRVTTHGMWGLAVITSPNVREAINFAVRYFDLTHSFNSLACDVDGHHVRLIYDDSDNPNDLRAALIERDMAALIALERDCGTIMPIQALTLRASRPAYAGEFEPIFGVVPRWNSALNSIVIDAALLDMSSPLADSFAQHLCEEQCAALLKQRSARAGLSGCVRLRLLRKGSEFPSMDIVAAELGLSTRTLRNKLGREGTSYRELLEAVRETLAEQLLSAEPLTIDQIAERLGYADSSSFIAAFKRWKGVPPHDYRTKYFGAL